MKPSRLLLISVLAFSCAAQARSAQANAMPLSTKSSEVLRLLDQAWILESDQSEQAKADEILRKVVTIDPGFAMGHEILAQVSLDQIEQVSEQKKAFANRSHANPAEQTVIDWFQSAADHKLIPAITNMNEALHQYPRDRWLVYLANSWLMTQMQYERAAAVYENSGITDSPGLINSVAYTYAQMRQFSKAFRLMDKFVAMLPNDANPQDSYAEILRMAGHYNVAIDHYRTALSINRKFYTSQFGIADTYLLMGDEVRARKEYELAFQKFPSIPELDAVKFKMRQATSYLYEGDFEGADKAFQAIADYAQSRHLSQLAADAYRQMAMYQPHPAQALEWLNKADAALQGGENALPLQIHQEAAQILRARVELAVKSGDNKAENSALAHLAELSLDSNDKVIDSAYHGAAGAHLCHERKYKEAIPHLEEDGNNPLSLEQLATAYRMTGYFSGSRHVERVLASLNDPTVEQALVVPAFRQCLRNPTCNVSVKNVAMETKH